MAHIAARTFEVPHPILTPADLALMGTDELFMALDTPEAHIAAFVDFQRDAHLARRNEMVDFFTLAAAIMADLEPYDA